eukprot:PhF_6_TR29180/c0_g1_i1/m.42675/K10632/BRAP; BRCA1-associated protein
MDGLCFSYFHGKSKCPQTISLSKEPSDTVVLRDIPTFFTPQEVLELLNLTENDSVRNVVIVSTIKPATYALIVLFANSTIAEQCHESYHSRPLSALSGSDDLLVVLYCHSNVAQLHVEDEEAKCPVCLEQVGGAQPHLLSVCSHLFHLTCYAHLQDPHCPICRHSVTDSHTTCSHCEQSVDLWMCVICGYVGCGRKNGGHAEKHFSETLHTYAVELSTQKVWDYAGDGYVHRLLTTSSSDQKVVEGFGGRSNSDDLDTQTTKVESSFDAVAHQYNRILEEQLTLQQRHYRRAHEAMLELWVQESMMDDECELREEILLEWMNGMCAMTVKFNAGIQKIIAHLETAVLKDEEVFQLEELRVVNLQKGVEKYQHMWSKIQAQREEIENIESDPEVKELRKQLADLYTRIK